MGIQCDAQNDGCAVGILHKAHIGRRAANYSLEGYGTPTKKRKHMLRVGGDQSSIAMRDPKASELPENHGPLLGNFRESTRMCKQFARVNCTNISQPSPFRHFY